MTKVASHWFVWITAISDVYAESLAGRLVAHGWTVKSAGSVLTNSTEKGATIIGLDIYKQGEVAIDKSSLLEELKSTMKLLGMGWVSTIIANPTEAIWTTTTLEVPEPEPEVERTVH